MHITLEDDKTAASPATYTVTGVPYDDFRSILTAASIHHYETEKEINAKKPESSEKWLRKVEIENIAAEKEWAKQIRSTLDHLEKLALDAIQASNRRQTEEAKENAIDRRVQAELKRRHNCTKVGRSPKEEKTKHG